MLGGLLVASASGRCAIPSPPPPSACDGDIVYGERDQLHDHKRRAGPRPDVLRQRRGCDPGPGGPTGGTVNPLTSVRFGAGIVCGPTFADELTCELTSTGTQTLRVDSNGSGNGSFVTTIERLNDPSACTALPYGPTGKTGAINQQVEMDCFAHAGAASGQRWQVRVVETSRPRRRCCSRSCAPTGPRSAGRPAPPRPPACSTPRAPTGSTSTPAAACRPPTTGSCSRSSRPRPDCTAAAYGDPDVANVANAAGRSTALPSAAPPGDVIRVPR